MRRALFVVAACVVAGWLLLDTVTEPAAEPSPTSGPRLDAPEADWSNTYRARATRLADGDSFEVEWFDESPPGVDRDEVRLLGINAPETDACFGPEARDVLATLIEGRDLAVEIVETEDDGFGRQIANVWVDDDLINAAMVERGAAIAMSNGGPHADAIARAQASAQAGDVGVWARCTSASSVVITHLRYDASGRDDQNPNDEWIEIVNEGAAAIDLTGWSIRDESTRHRFAFPSGFALDADAAVRIRSGCGVEAGVGGGGDLYWCASDPVWNNGGDTAWLVDAYGRFVDEWGYAG